MVLYDYSKESSLNSILYVTISVICIVCLTVLTIFAIRTYIKGWSEHAVFLSIAIVVLLIISIFLSHQAFMLSKYNVICTRGNYEITIGTIEDLHVSRNDYRDEELYSIDFTVDGVEFKNLVNGFSDEQRDLLTSFNDDVEVRYSYVKGEIMIYQIVANTIE